MVLVLTNLSLLAQNENPHFCYTSEAQEELFEADAALHFRADSLSDVILKRAKNPNSEWFKKDGDPYIIPVVFHIVHAGGEENISFAQIEDAVQHMTDDFNANNVFIDNVNENFVDLIADVGIEFRLAQRDPEGNCTNGVVRTYNTLTNQGGENLKEISPIWDRSKYLNIWVCKTIASGAAGYTYYPSSLDGSFGETNDGIVVRHDYVGGIGTSSIGRAFVLSHEVGHWIDLPHLWGSTNEPNVDSNCETDDGVDDTPNTIGWTSCNVSGQTCGSLDNVENFMEYSYCSKMFTHGQKTRMLAALTSNIAERNSLWTEENLIATGVLEEPELCKADFSSNRRTVCLGETVDFSDLSFSGVASRTWIFEGGQPVTSTDEDVAVTYTSPGIYSVSLVANDSFGNQLTEVKESYIQVLDTGFSSLPFTESFESAQTFDELENEVLFVESGLGNDIWEISSEAGSTGNQSAVFRATEAEQSVHNSTLITKTFQMNDVVEDPILSFKYAAARGSFSGTDELWIYISRNCGEAWSLRKVLDAEDIYTVDGVYNQGFIPEDDHWVSQEISNIISVFHTEEFRIKFEYRGQNGGTIYLDDINLIDPATLNTAFQSSEELAIYLYPNPAGDGVNLKFKQDAQVERMVLRDISGRVVDELPILNRSASSEMFVDLSRFSSGIYLLEVQTENGSVAKKLIIE